MPELSLLDWLLLPLDPDRPHQVSVLVSWHGRLMVLAWGILLPLGVLIARYFKVAPRQNWPAELDNRLWWHAHLSLQWFGVVLSLTATILILRELGEISFFKSPHRGFAWLALLLLAAQVLAGLFRGSRGGPTYPAPDGSWRGDHYDMTRRRRIFECSHKLLGYLALLCGAIAILSGLHTVNAPVWMWGAILLWWGLLLVAAVYLQTTLGALDTYQAIWGPDPELPGNRLKPIGFGIKRHQSEKET